MKLHGLLANHQARTNLGVGQAFHTAQCHLGLAAAQISILCDSLNHTLVRTVAATRYSLSISDKAILISARNYFFRRKYSIGNTLITRPVGVRAPLALNAKLADETFQSAPDRA